MKPFTCILLLACLAAGCATSTIESRKKERAGAYANLSPEWRDLVNQGQIKVGMPQDAVYVAWGRPNQILTSQSSGGATTTWLYLGTSYQEYRYWTYSYYPRGRHGYASPHLDYDYIPQNYVAAEVAFENGVVKTWRNLTPPR